VRAAGGKTVVTAARVLRRGKYLVRIRRHVLAIVDGQVHDWTDGRQHRVQQVFEIIQPAAVVETPVALPTPAPIPRPAPKAIVAVRPIVTPSKDVAAPARALRQRLLAHYDFTTFQLDMSGKFVKFNTLQGTVYLNPSRHLVRLFVRNEETLQHIRPMLEAAGLGKGTATAKYTFWMLTMKQLKDLRAVL
jgi:hypothetical protein